METSLARHFGGLDPGGVSGCRINTKSKTNVFTRTCGRQKRHLTVRASLLYNFIFTCTNKLNYEN